MTTGTSQTLGSERVDEVRGVAKNEAEGVAHEVKYQARDLVTETRGQVREQVDTQKSRVADLLREVGDDLQQMADRSDRPGVAGDLVRQLAARARDARGYLEGDGDLVADVRGFARRRPGTFILGALAAGVLAGRATRGAVAARGEQQPSPSPTPTPEDSDAQPVYSPGYAAEYTDFGPDAVSTAAPDRFAGGLPEQPEELPPATQAVPSTGSTVGVGYSSSPAGITPENPQPESLRPGYAQQGYTENWAEQRVQPQPRLGEPVDPGQRSDVSLSVDPDAPLLDPDAPLGPDSQERR